MLVVLGADVEKGENGIASAFYKCELGKSKIMPNNGLSTHPAF